MIISRVAGGENNSWGAYRGVSPPGREHVGLVWRVLCTPGDIIFVEKFDDFFSRHYVCDSQY